MVRSMRSIQRTGARVRVLIESTDGSRRWGTVGVSANVVEASWQALLDSVEFKLHKDQAKARKPAVGDYSKTDGDPHRRDGLGAARRPGESSAAAGANNGRKPVKETRPRRQAGSPAGIRSQ